MSASNQTTNDPEFGLPVGAVLPFASGIAVPHTFLLCNGASVLRSEYPYLFASIGTIYGSVDALHFNVPQLTNNYIKGSAVNAGTITPSNIVGSVQFNPITTDNLPATAIPLTSDYTFSGTFESIIVGNADGEDVSCVLGPNTMVGTGNGTMSGAQASFGGMTLASANANSPVAVPINTNSAFSLKGYTMPYIIKASPAFVAVF